MATPSAGTHFYGSEQQWLVTLNVGGFDYGVFDTFTGGDVTAPAVKHRPGGMGPEVTYNSLPMYSDVTVGRVYSTQRDHPLIAQLHTQAGNQLASITLQPLDDNGVPWGSPRVYQGRLISIKDGKTDSNSNSPRVFEVDIAVETIQG
jgi:hypothetical protein